MVCSKRRNEQRRPRRCQSESAWTRRRSRHPSNRNTMSHSHAHLPFSALATQLHDDRSSSRSRSVSSSAIANSTTSISPYTNKPPLSVQPPAKSERRPSPLSMDDFRLSRTELPNGMLPLNSVGHQQVFINLPGASHAYDTGAGMLSSAMTFPGNVQVRLVD